MTMYKRMKIRVNSLEYSADVQNILIDLGYKWGKATTETTPLSLLPGAWIYTDEDGHLTWNDYSYRGVDEYKIYKQVSGHGVFSSFERTDNED